MHKMYILSRLKIEEAHQLEVGQPITSTDTKTLKE
jgi:hypothetical protein